MAGLMERFGAWLRGQSVQQRSLPSQDMIHSFNGIQYPTYAYGLGMDKKAEDIENSFTGYVSQGYKANGVVFATILARMLVFTEARFQWQRINSGRPGDLFGSQDLSILERPWPNGTTGELLARMEQDVSLAGNFYCVREGDRLRRLRPDWVSIILSAPPSEAVESDVVGYQYTPGGAASNVAPVHYLPEDVCHWSPIPDPEAQYRGMSWLTPIAREILADGQATEHKLNFFRNGASLGPIFTLKESVTEDQFRKFVQAASEAHVGVGNAYKPLYMGGGADVTLSQADLRQLDFRSTQGAGETRITAAGGVPAVIVGLSEGLQAATYSNFGQARRKFGDHWARPQWRSACAALQTILTLPNGAADGTVRLWYDDRDIAFLREDARDAAEIIQTQAATIVSLVNGGFKWQTAVAAVVGGDLNLLDHTGLLSVQLQIPTAGLPPASPAATDALVSSPSRAQGENDLKHYWTKGAGLAKWIGSPHPWTALRDHIAKYVPPGEADRIASEWFHEVFGIWPGERKGRNPVGKG